jgi:ribonuclease Z
MIGDHVFGLVPLLASRLNGAGGTIEGIHDTRQDDLVSSQEPAVEIYGPPGTRAYVRSALLYTYTLLSSLYIVHELHHPSSSDPTAHFQPSSLPLNAAESPHGRDIVIDEASNTWTDILVSGHNHVKVSAAPIQHSVFCLGYVVEELPVPGKMNPGIYIPHLKRTGSPMSLLSVLQGGENVTLNDGTVLEGPKRRKGRKVVILGDTYDPSPIADIAQDCDVLVHEATNAYLPHVDPNTNALDTETSVELRAVSHGHSTPQMAGKFAKRVNARLLVLNHFSARYAAPKDEEPLDRNKEEESESVSNRKTKGDAGKIMEDIKILAEKEVGIGGAEVRCAKDLWGFDVTLPPLPSS